MDVYESQGTAARSLIWWLSLALISGSVVLQTLAGILFIEKKNYDLMDQGDTSEYVAIADNILAGNGYSIDTEAPWRATASRSPGMLLTNAPLRLFFAGHPWLVLIPGHLVMLAAALLCLSAGRSLAGNDWGCLAGPLVTTIPSTVYYGVNPYASGPPYLLAFCFILWAAIRVMQRKRAGLIFLALGCAYAMSLRPATVFPLAALVASFLVLALIARERAWRTLLLRAALVAMVGTLSVYLAWSFRNYREFGAFRYSSIHGYNMLHANVRGMRKAMNPAGQAEIDDMVEDQGIYINSYSGPDQMEVSHRQGEAALAFIRKHPTEFLSTHFGGSAQAFFQFRAKEIKRYAPRPIRWAIEAWQIFLTGASLLGCFQIVKNGPPWRRAVVLSVGAAGLLSVLSGGAIGKPKFRIPLEPLVAVGTAVVLAHVAGRIEGSVRSQRRRGISQ